MPEEPPALESDPDAAPLPAEPQVPAGSEPAPAAYVEPPAAEDAPHDVEPGAPEAGLPEDLDPEALPIAPPEPADPPQLPVPPTTAPDELEAEPGRAPADPPEAMAPPPVEFESYAEESDGQAQPQVAPPQAADLLAPSEHGEHLAPAEPGPAADSGAPEAAGYAAEPQPGEPWPAPDTAQYPAAEAEIAPYAADQEPAAAPLPPEHAPYASEPPHAAAAESPPLLDPAEAEPAPSHDTASEEPRQGYAIPGLPEPEGPEPRPGLPEPPKRVRAAQPTPMRRAFRRVDDGPGGAPLAGEGRSAPGGRDGRSRWIAVLALLAIGIVVAVLVYSLKPSSSNHPAAKGPAEVKVLIPEGKTRLQIAQIASAAGLTGSYRRAARSSPLLNPAQYGAPKGTKTLEGFLFPATYDMTKGAPSQRLVEEQVTAFQENFSAEYAKRAKELGLTPYELLTVASMIEREAQVPSDRAKIATVIYNRLKAGIPTGIDAAIYYAVENADNIPTYTKELTASQLQMNSAYNTRLHKGLPPTPISNPGVASIQAAAHPAHASYLYYVAGADGCGEQVFSTTEAKFNEDVAAYEAAKRANGGHLPACKHH